jgi:hypothetical protein
MTIVRPSDDDIPMAPDHQSRDQISTNEMSPIVVDKLPEASKLDALVETSSKTDQFDEFSEEPPVGNVAPHTKTLAGFTPSSPSVAMMKPQTASFSQQAERNMETMDVRAMRKRSKAPWIIVSVLGVAALGAGVFVGYDLLKDDGGTPVAAADAAVAPAADATKVAIAEDASVKVATDDAAAPTAVDAAAPTAIDAAVVAVADAAKPVDPPPSGELTITSTPANARVYVNGADKGVTPVKLPGTPDKYNIAVYLAGHELYLAPIPGSGAHVAKLKEVTPPGGPAGIKVIQCKNKEQYYVYVDGAPTGMACPTERIQVQLGDHTVEVYDMVSEAKRSFPVSVKDTRLSVRVKVE